jgi:Rrf2 family nitric oxide-sensitive transcriptional repressor
VKLTSQEEYGLRCILGLARLESQATSDTGPSVTIAQIADMEGLSTEYVGKLMGILTRSGLIESVRGRNGGYRLARRAADISLSDALAALGEPLYVSETCGRFPGDQNLCVHTSACSIRSLWGGLQLLLDHILKRTTLADLVRAQEHSVAAWMRSHIDAVDAVAPLGQLPAPVPEAATHGNVVVRAPKHG